MRLDSLITAMQTLYPELFPTRLRALDHLFLTIGNGFEWTEAGDLAMDEYPGEDEGTMPLARKLDAGEVDASDLSTLRELTLQKSAASMAARMNETYDKMRARAKAEGITETIENDVSCTAAYWVEHGQKSIAESKARADRGEFEPYPLSRDFSRACTVPDNVQQDFLAGAVEILSYVAGLTPVYTGECKNEAMLVHFHRRKAETVALAAEILAELRTRFAARLP